MIGKLTGHYGGVMRDGSVLIEAGGVGYTVRAPASVIVSLGAEGSSASLYIHTAVREDAIDLYGFSTEEELSFFKQLTRVSGIGPKSALGILNSGNVLALKRAIAQGDAAVLTRVHGIGKKSAERVVVELREKLEREGLGGSAGERSVDGEVLEALETLGYRAEESRRALKSLDAGVGDVRERLASALRFLGSPVS